MSIIGWKEIYTHTVTGSAETSITIPDLHGDQDICYKLEARIVNGYNGNITVRLRPNNDTGSNYGRQLLYGTNTTAAALRDTDTGIQLTDIDALGSLALIEGTLFAKSGYVRTFISTRAQSVATTTVGVVAINGFSWNNTADEITSLVILAAQTGGLGIGSQITLSARSTIYGIKAGKVMFIGDC